MRVTSPSVVIPVAGMGTRMRSAGPKALLKLDRETVLARQLRVIGQVWGDADVVVVVGFGADKVIKTLPPRVRWVVNHDYETTNTARSTAIGVRACRRDKVLVVYGDLVFDHLSLLPLILQRNSCVMAKEDARRKYEVGVVSQGGLVTNFSFGLPDKWAHLLLLEGRERRMYLDLCRSKKKDRLFTYEVLNEMIDLGAEIERVPFVGGLTEIDCGQDLREARRFVESSLRV